jgi:hypothetical protein
LQGLVQGNEKKDKDFVMNVDCIANFYGKWIGDEIGPFDIGTTTINGLRPLSNQNKRKAKCVI